MRLKDVTPEWVLARMKAAGMTQAKVAAEIVLEQHKLSKSLTGKRNLRVSEREGLARLLCEPDPPEMEPENLDLARRFAALSEDRKALMRAMLDTLEAQQQSATPPTPPDNGAQNPDSGG
jgi:transcriptional regulator with XRE-family HTH domain